MQKKMKKLFAYVLTLCMILGMAQIPAVTGRASEDGVIDTSEEGYEIVRYYTGTETAVTAAQTKNERLTDFFAGTESMEWSVDFKTSGSGLKALLALNSSDKYYVLYVKQGKLAFEVKGGQIVTQSTATNYADDQWHTAKVVLKKNGKITLYADGTSIVEADTNAASCIKNLGWTPSAFTIGGVTGYGSESSTAGWTFSGSMRNIVLKKEVAVQGDGPVLSLVNPKSGSTVQGIQGTASQGSADITYRLAEGKNGRVKLLGFGASGELYLDTAANKVGLQAGAAKFETAVANTKLNTEKWHHVTVAWDGGNASVYVDGASAGSGAFAAGVDVSSISFDKDVYYAAAEFYEKTLTAGEITELHAATASATYPDGTEKMEGYYKTENRELFNSGFDGSVAYRIPAIVTSRKTGTVIASIDKRWNHSGDVGKIDSVIRRSEDNGKTWSPIIPVIDMPDEDAYTVDPALVVDNKEDSPYYGRIYMLVDMYPYNIGLWASKPGTGYKEVDGVQCRVLYDANENEYTVRENGKVYDSAGNLTVYEVETEAEAPYKEQGALYKNGKKIGSIFKNSELHIYETTYLWTSYSDDDGKTWSLPKDITPMIKDDWMRFSGTGPGQGVQLQNGRIMFSAYCSHTGTSSALSSFHVYTDDGGETWHRGASPNDISETNNASNSTRELNENSIVQLDNGHLIQFMKNATNQVAMAISTNNGASWGEVKYASGITEPYCNLSALHYPGKIVDPRDGRAKEAIIFANPRGTHNFVGNGREGGTVRIAFVNADDTLDWAYSKLIEENRFIYCSLTVMNDGNIGMIYEHQGYAEIGAAFTSFSPEYIMDGNQYENTPAPKNIAARILDADGQETTTLTAGSQALIDVTFSQNVFAAGNVTLNIEVGKEKKEAVLVGNAGSDTLRFAYEIAEGDAGKLTATSEVNIKEGGVAETVYNVSLTDKPITTKNIVVGTVAASAANAFAELPVTGMSATAGSAYTGATEGPASLVLDGRLDTHWHSMYPTDNVSNGGRPKHWITIDLGGSRLVNGLVYTPRSGGLNGCVTKYQIEVSTNGTDFVPVAVGDWMKSSDVKTAEFGGAVLATHVKFRVLETGDDWATAAEIRIIGTADTSAAQDKTALLNKLMSTEAYRNIEAAAQVLENAYQVAENAAATKEEVQAAAAAVAELEDNLAAEARENLPAAIEKGDAKKKDNYSVSAWYNYVEAMSAAKAVTSTSTALEVIEAYQNLAAAEKKLEESRERRMTEEQKAANEILKEHKEILAAGKTENCPEAAWTAYEKACAELEKALDDDEKDSAVLQKLAEAVKAAKTAADDAAQNAGDVKKAAAETLAAAKAVAEKGQGTYTDDSWKAYMAAYEALKKAVEENQDAVTLQNLMTALKGVKLVEKASDQQPGIGEPGVKQGETYTVKTLKYKVTDLKKKTVELVGTENKNLKSISVPKTVTISGIKFQVTSIGAKALKNCKKLKKATIGANVTAIGKQAFAGCKKLGKITIKGKKLKSVKAKAFKGIAKKAVIKVPKAKKAKYKKLLSKKGQPKTVKIK